MLIQTSHFLTLKYSTELIVDCAVNLFHVYASTSDSVPPPLFSQIFEK